MEKASVQINKLLDKYKQKSAPFKAGVWFTICNILQKGISMITVPIFTRILTTEQYGVYSVYQSWYLIITIFATLNLFYGVFNNGMVKYENDRDRFMSSVQGLTTVLTTVVFVIYLAGRNFWNDLLGLSSLFVVFMFVELYFAPALSFWSARQRFEFKYKTLVIITLAKSVASPVIGIIAVLSTSYKAEARVISYVLVEACFGLVLYIYNASKGKKFFVKDYWKFALAFNIPLVPHYLSQMVLQQADRIMISNMVGKDKAAIYSVAYNISALMSLITNAVNNSYIPYTYDSIKKKKYGDLSKNTNILVAFVALISIVVMLFGPEIVAVFAPVEYYEAVYIIPPVSASIFFMFLYPVFGNVEFYYEENKFIMVASMFGAAANVLLNYICIPIFGYIAAGYTTLVCYMIFSGAHYLFMLKVLKKHSPGLKIYNSKFILMISVLELALMLLVMLLYSNMFLRYGIILAGAAALVIFRKRVKDFIFKIKNLKGSKG